MTPSDADSDAADIRALQHGEKQALDRLMNRWQIPLRRFLFRHTQNEDDALDLAQETFVRVYRHSARFKTGARFSTWMFSIAHHLACDRARSRMRRPTQALDSIPEPFEDGDLLSDVEREERAVAVRAAIQTLPEDLKSAVILFEYEDMSHAEIAEVIRASPKAVETRLYRARQLLRKSLSAFLQVKAR